MKIVIPMSGFGERFRRAGYQLPKSLISVEGKPMIHHVIDLFPGDNSFVFICNQDHLESTEMRSQINQYCSDATIVSIPSHKLGPVYAVSKAYDYIDDDEPVIVNYCDFACRWNFNDFQNYVIQYDLDGSIPAYRGFHPHSLGTTNYAYIQTNKILMTKIKEKEPFTDDRINEFASTGAYYFKTGSMLKKYFSKTIQDEICVNGEYYCSLPYNLMVDDGLKIGVYEIEHFMQWGTPDDVLDYNYYSRIFHSLGNSEADKEIYDMTLLLPMAGLGSRFRTEGFEIPKPFLPITGKPMYQQAIKSLPNCSQISLTYLREHHTQIITDNFSASSNLSTTVLEETPNGQALTCLYSLSSLAVDKPVLISACDHAITYDHQVLARELDSDFDIIVFGISDYPFAKKKPTSYSWIETNPSNVISNVSVKQPFSDLSAPVLIGTFIFKDSTILSACINSLLDSSASVNGEYYLDSCINNAISLGFTCRYFEVDNFVCWGTPDEYKTFCYWQKCFDLWESHPYTMRDDNWST